MDLSHPLNTFDSRGKRKINQVIGANILEPHSAVIDYTNQTLL